MIEAAVVGRAVHAVRVPEFRDTQEGTLHFRLLLAADGRCVELASSFDEHLAQLGQALREPERSRREVERFVRSFVRPAGLDKPATPILVGAIERLSDRGGEIQRMPLPLAPVRALLWLAARWLARREGATGGLATEKAAGHVPRRDFTHPLPRSDLYRLVARRYLRVARSVVRRGLLPQARDQASVSELYERHYEPDNAAYARSRDRRRDVFMVGRRPVYTDGWFTIRFHLETLLHVLRDLDVESVLEVGSGRGTNIALLAMRRPDLRFAGLELTENGIRHSRDLVRSPTAQHVRAAGLESLGEAEQKALRSVRFHLGSALDMPLAEKSVDVSFTCLVLEQLPDTYPRILAEMRRVTRGYCAFIEPFGDANNLLGKAYLRSIDYFRASHRRFAEHGFEVLYFSTTMPQKVHFRTGLLLARVLP
jgi:ubiquinone/menaquinone biosynthesis C-methylase UbiE